MKDIINKRFGQHPSLQLDSMEWLELATHAKTVKFDIGQGGLPPDVTWEDRCAAVALIADLPARALATLLVWGYSDEQFNIVTEYLAGEMVQACRTYDGKLPVGCIYTMPELAGKMARMTLYFTLYDLWDLYTVEGRLVFCGIDINPRTYSNQLLAYQRDIEGRLAGMVATINQKICEYKRALD